MDASNRDALSAVIARQRGRARLRAATIALGAASLVAAGAVASALPGVTHPATSTSAAGQAGTAGTTTTVHAASGGSAGTTASSAGTTAGSAGTGSASTPAAASGAGHATSGGS